jgi:hypothetical protein
MARIEYRVLSAQGDWRVTKDGKDVSKHSLKQDAVTEAKRLAKQDKASGHDTQLVIQKSDGTWQTEWTYGHDPFPPAG